MVPVLELRLGYAAAPAVRLEVLAEYRPRFAFGGHANFLETGRRQSVTADLSSLSGMLAAYVDLAGLGVPRLGSLEPFVGAGVGAVDNRIGETRMTFPKTTTIVPRASRTNVAWMLTAGFAVPLGEGTTLDLAWRYTATSAWSTRAVAVVGWSGATGAASRVSSILAQHGQGSWATDSECRFATRSEVKKSARGE